MRVLALNPGSASLKFELIEVSPGQQTASEGKKLVSASVEELGPHAKLLVYQDRKIDHEESIEARDMAAATTSALQWLRNHHQDQFPAGLNLVAVRVVHGGAKFAAPARYDPSVKHEIEQLQELAPLHNQSALQILSILEQQLPNISIMVTFDTSFHRTLPERAWRYAIGRELADRFGIRKFGFHGLSHRYMLEQYAKTIGKRPDEVSIVTLHLESGCSAAAIERGKSIDTTMGLTPLEGLMMGTRSGSIDPAIVSFLMHKLDKSDQEVMQLLNKQSGLLGIAGETFDTRILVKRIGTKRSDATARLALDMFCYRILLAVGSYLTLLPKAEAVIFGGGIGEDTPLVRREVCAGLRAWGIEIDEELNARSTAGAVCLTTPESRFQVHVIPAEEELQMAHECSLEIL